MDSPETFKQKRKKEFINESCLQKLQDKHTFDPSMLGFGSVWGAGLSAFTGLEGIS